jgi:hypothetical protein
MNKGNLYYDENNIEYSAVAHQEQKVIRNWCDKCGLIKVSQIWKGLSFYFFCDFCDFLVRFWNPGVLAVMGWA